MVTGTGDGGDKQVDGLQPDWKEQLVEVLIFLFLIVPSTIFSQWTSREATSGFTFTAWATILRDMGLVALILLFLWRNGEPLHRIGWMLKHAREDVAIGALLFLPFTAAAGLAQEALRVAGLSGPSSLTFLIPQGWGQILLAIILVVVVAIAEEMIFRGYLILRFRTVTRSSLVAAILSAVVFSLGHAYEGAAGVATVGLMGVAFALVYNWRQSLVAPIVMHFLQDLGAIVLAPFI